jgi:hypothetical protein
MDHDEIRSAVARLAEIAVKNMTDDSRATPEDKEAAELTSKVVIALLSQALDLHVAIFRIADSLELIANPTLRLKELDSALTTDKGDNGV